jgi:putative membrane protein
MNRIPQLISLTGEAMTSRGILARAGSVVLAALTLSACAKKDENAADTTAASSTLAVTDSSSASSTAPGSGLSDANIAYILDNANAGDSAAGSIAATKGTNSQVREFGKRMMRDHHLLRQQGQELVKKLALTPTPPAGDTLPAGAQRTTDLLNNTAKGKDFDRAYMDNEVAVHKSVLQIATDAMAAAQNTELKNLIQKAAPVVQAHLDMAEKIQTSLK